jgi:hypothetical protein
MESAKSTLKISNKNELTNIARMFYEFTNKEADRIH